MQSLRCHPFFAFAIALMTAACMTLGYPQAQMAPPQDVIEELVGASVFAADGGEVGEVASISIHSDGQIKEIRMTTPSPMGIGTRVVILPRGSYMLLRGAVVVDLSRAEVDALPTATAGAPT
jgi:hypothetical protein